MSIAPAASRTTAPVDVPATWVAASPRVRHQARDAATVMAFSAAASVGVAVVFLLLAVAARQA